MSRTIIYFHVYLILDFPIIYRNASVFCQSECACLHQTVNLLKNNENTHPKGRALLQIYRVVRKTKRGNLITPAYCSQFSWCTLQQLIALCTHVVIVVVFCSC